MARSARTDDMAPTDERNLTLDERIFRGRSEHTCLKRLDELMFCLSAALAPASHRMRLAHTFSEFRCHGTAPTNQFTKYYYEGTYDYCPARFRAWHLCLKTKLSKPEHALEIQKEARPAPACPHYEMHSMAHFAH